jgi:hypothetical protein
MSAQNERVRTARPDVRQELLETRQHSFYVRYIAHLQEAARMDRYGRLLGLAVVILTTIVGTSAFAAIQGDPSVEAKVAVGTISVIAAVLAAVKEFAAFGKRTAEHTSAAATYLGLRHKAEELIVKLRRPDTDKVIDEIAKLDTAFDKEQASEPPLSDRRYQEAKRIVDKELLDKAGGLSKAF